MTNLPFLDEVLHYIRRKEGGGLAKVICTKEKAKEIFMELHSSAIGAHCGIHKTLDAVSRRFYWPGMSLDIKKWVSAISCVNFYLCMSLPINKQETRFYFYFYFSDNTLCSLPKETTFSKEPNSIYPY